MAAPTLSLPAETAGKALLRLKFRHKKTALQGGLIAGVSRFTSQIVLHNDSRHFRV